MLTLFDTNPELCAKWREAFHDCSNVKVLESDVADIPEQDYLITAGNSYGIMNGGIDLSIRNILGIKVQDLLQWSIVSHYGGRMPTGSSLIIELENCKFSNLVYSVTMEKPQAIVVSDLLLVFYNILLSLNLNTNIACPGLGTGAGKIPPKAAAKAMRQSYDLFMLGGNG